MSGGIVMNRILRYLNALSLRRRLLVVPALGLALIGLLTAAFVYESRQQNELLIRIVERDFAEFNRHTDVFIDLSAQHIALYDLLTNARKIDEETLYDDAKNRLHAIHEAIRKLEKTLPGRAAIERSGDEGATALRGDVLALMQAYRRTVTSSVEMTTVNIELASSQIALANERFIAMNRVFARLLDVQRKGVALEIAGSVDYGKKEIAVLGVLGVSFAALLLVLSIALSRFLSRSLEAQISVLAEIGGPTRTDTKVRSVDEVARIGEAIAAFRRTQLELRDSEERFRAAFEQAAVGMGLRGVDPPRWLQVNQKLCEILGYTREELLQLTSLDVTPSEDRDLAVDYNEQLLRGDITSYSREKRYMRKDGTIIWTNISLTAVRGPDGRPSYVMSVIQDVSERKQAEERLRKVDRARKVMAECNHVMVHASDEIQLLQDMCKTAVASGGYRMAWVGFAEHDEDKSVRVIANAGIDEGYLDASRISWGDNERGRGPSGLAIRSGQACVVRNVLTDPNFAPWRDSALERGYRSHIALPLARHGVSIGVLSLYTTEVDAFDADEVALLEELAADLAYGIVSLRTRIDHARAEASLKASEELMRNTFDHAAVGIAHTSIDDRYLLVNRRLCEILGYTRDELLVMRAIDITHPDDRDDEEDYQPRLVAGEINTHSVEKRYVRKDGAAIWVNRTVSLVRDSVGKPLYFISVVEDISERKHAVEQMVYLAQYDPLTDLPNRNLLRDRLKLAMARAKRNEQMLAVMFLDLDQFKEINDTLGHAAGDEVLQAVAGLLRDSLRDVDIIARMGGDEFTVVLENIAELVQVTAVAEKIKQAFSVPIVIREHEMFVTASIGITIYPRDENEIGALLQMADVAMYHAKAEGRNTYEFYAPELDARAAGRLHMQGLLRRALERQQFVLHYQPKIDLAKGTISGLEALMRWNDPGTGLVPPAQFIPLLEETRMILDAGRWVIRQALADYCNWHKQGLQPPRIEVNVSPIQLRQKNFVDVVREAIMEFPSHALDLEITESLIMEDIEGNIKKLRMLKDMGINIAIDDFGTGYSSLGYLAKLPADALKIDRSFIITMTNNPDSMTIVSTIISLAHALNLKVIAEGVDSEEQSKFLKLLRCDEIQGYIFSKPLPATELIALMMDGRRL